MGLTLGIRYLCGRVTATHPADREAAEWPVHPDRVFMALAAAHFETGRNEGERAALHWLEQRVPRVLCTSAAREGVVTSYVPVNDTSAPRVRRGHEPSPAQVKSGLELLPENRSRQPRCFPSVYPAEDVVYFTWDETPDNDVFDALGSLCRKVTYLGHSSSLVQMWTGDTERREVAPIVDQADDSQGNHDAWLNLVPQLNGLGRFRLRVPSAGRMDQLESAFKRSQRPLTATCIGYDHVEKKEAAPDVAGSQFSPDLIVLRQVAGPRFGLPSTQLLTHHLRRTIMSTCPGDPPEWISGHSQDNGPSKRNGGHMALVPLTHVGRQHADGRLLGLAIVVPRNVSPGELSQCLKGLLFDAQGWGKTIALQLGSQGECVLQLDDGSEYRETLDVHTWTKASRRWATVTPICLDRHPHGQDYWQKVETQIADGCKRIGLPSPAMVIASPSPMFAGVPHGRDMPHLARKSDGGQIRHTHAVILFDQPVRGPVILGSGRYRGYGWCRPLGNGRSVRR